MVGIISIISLLIFSIYIVSLVLSNPLTILENENRLRACGKVRNSKVYQGDVVDQSKAPWSVQLQVPGGACTASLISPRHILTASHCFADKNVTNDEEWKVDTEDIQFDSCNDGNYHITDESILSEISILSSNTTIPVTVTKVTLLHVCESKFVEEYSSLWSVYDDVAIIHLQDDVTFSRNLWPACVAENREKENPGTRLDYYGYGLNPPPGVDTANHIENITGVLRHENTQTIERPSRVSHFQFPARNSMGDTIICPGDSGGGAVFTDTDGTVTVVGVLSLGTCDQAIYRSEPDKLELYGSVGYYSEDICHLTGVCPPLKTTTQTTMGPPTRPVVLTAARPNFEKNSKALKMSNKHNGRTKNLTPKLEIFNFKLLLVIMFTWICINY